MGYNGKDVSGENNPNYRHGLYKTREWYIYNGVKNRCTRTNIKQAKDYTDRGITMIQDWINNPEVFIEYIKNLPNYNKKGYTLDRENNDGNYEPGNLRWIDRHTQNSNRRVTKKSKTGYSGIFIQDGRYKACIAKKYLGMFDSIELALDARNSYITKHNLTEYKKQLFNNGN